MKKTFSLTLIFLLVLPALLSGGCREPTGDGQVELLIPPRVIAPKSYTELADIFNRLDYDLDTLDRGVPPLLLQRFPPDMGRIPTVGEKKRLFYLGLLPMALMLNEEIRLERKRLQRILGRVSAKRPLSIVDRAFLDSLQQAYHVRGDVLRSAAVREKLLRRVDMIPVELLLAQAANESAYGTSRFCLAANNLFGEWTFVPGTGIVPEGRPAGETYEVRVFSSLYESLRSYARNINTHWAYESLRRERERLRREGLPLSGTQLAGGLHLYSTRRQAYVDDIRALIRHNRLERLARSELRPSLRRKLYGRQDTLVAVAQ
ncbi:Bax protein [Geothermobacter ehrlichii]|uniref:Bax protein n=1 Tax=Geothermobacter ehrlichii TaxID=213224 RepID=A0A5D3WR22_9BACT|nr:glucosaminidase domain-containing protein [Geothermobacter ehrlichii]TYP00240.1 Bax protein [Geothermobacter ehrlichii]